MQLDELGNKAMRAAVTGKGLLLAVCLSAVLFGANATIAGMQRDGVRSASVPGGLRCADLAGTGLPHGRIDRAELIAAGDYQPPSGPKIRDLPAFCRVVATAEPTARSKIGFEVWLPAESWSGRLHMVGNGGYSSEIHFAEMGALLRAGATVVGTDTGHRSNVATFGDLEFGVDNVEAIIDWGNRAVHESVSAAKIIVKSYYGRPQRYAYFSGCSTGGHQGLMEAQRYPEDFDGILSGAPGNNRTNLNLAFLWMFLSNHEPGDNVTEVLDREALKVVNRAVITQCDRLDGVADGVVNDPRQCRFDPAVTLCRPGETHGCLTERQVGAVKAIYAGPRRSSSGEVLYPGWPAGSEFVTGQGATMGWDLYWANLAKPHEPQRSDYFRYWVFNNPNWNWWNFNWDGDVERARQAMAENVDAINPDLSAFKARGGKLVIFSGWQDPVVSPYDTMNYYKAVVARQGGLQPTQAFARLFMVPGMMHCAGGPGATNFASSVRDSFPLESDAAHDLTLALQEWVEQGRAPTTVVAAKYANRTAPSAATEGGGTSIFPTIDPNPQNRVVVFTRKLCAYPNVAVFSGRGSAISSDSYACKPGRL